MVTEVVSLMKGEWSFYRGGQCNGGRMVMLQRWLIYWRENGHVTEVTSLREGERSCYRGCQFNRGRMVIFIHENDVKELLSLMEGVVILQWWCKVNYSSVILYQTSQGAN